MELHTNEGRQTPLIGPIATAGLLVAYFVVALLGAKLLEDTPAPVALVWPASGIGLALVLLRGPGVWPLIFAVATARAAFTLAGEPWPTFWASIALNGVGAALEPLLAAWLIWQFRAWGQLRRTVPFVLSMLLAAPVAAFIGTAPLMLGDVFTGLVTTYSGAGPIQTWHITATADVMGMITLTAPVWLWMRDGRPPLKKRELVELMLLGAGAALTVALPEVILPRYVLGIFLILAALRLPLQWASTVVVLASLGYLAQIAVALREEALWTIYGHFYQETVFVIVLNVAAYSAALLHRETRLQAAQLEGLIRAVGEAEERERGRIARVLHDEVQQTLVAAQMVVGQIQGGNESATGRAQSLIRQGIEANRAISTELHAPLLDDLGFPAAVEWLGKRFRETHRLNVTVEADDRADPDLREVSAFLLQAVRELLSNVVKHAGASAAWVRVRRANGTVTVEVEDDGKGCDPNQVGLWVSQARHFGLFNIRKRVELLGGTFEMAGSIGCRIMLAVPVSIRLDPFHEKTDEADHRSSEAAAQSEPGNSGTRGPS